MAGRRWMLAGMLVAMPADAINYAPLVQQDAAGWESALVAIIGVEQGLLDCMFR